MTHTHLPAHDHILCSVCGRNFPHPWHLVHEGLHACPSCSRPAPCRGGYEPMVQIEAGEHQRLLQLYYAHFENDLNPTLDAANAVKQAILRCNRYFEGGSPCH